MRKFWHWLNRIPHLFGKLMVLLCLGCMTVFCLYAFRIRSRTGHDPAALLGVALAPFGGELLIMFARDALSNHHTRKSTDKTKEEL